MAEEQEPFQRISVQDANKKREEGAAIIDCREADEYAEGHVVGAPLIPHMSVFERIDEVEQIAEGKNKPLMFICAKGQRSAVASEFAAAAGSVHTRRKRTIQVGGVHAGTGDISARCRER